MVRIVLLVSVFFLLAFHAISEDTGASGQIIRGAVVDKQTRMPLPGAHVILLGSDPLVATATNQDGEFRLTNVPLGRQSILVSFIGYHNGLVNNLIVNSGRETLLLIELEERVEITEEVIVVGNYRKDLALSQMASVSARTFTVEEAGRYAGTREDVARMAVNFAGVSGANDSRNDIIVRGNTYSKFVFSYVNQNGFTELDEFDPGEEPAPTYRENNLEDRLSFRYILNRRFNRKLSGRSGFTIDRFGYRLDSKGWKENDNRWEHWLNNKKRFLKAQTFIRLILRRFISFPINSKLSRAFI